MDVCEHHLSQMSQWEATLLEHAKQLQANLTLIPFVSSSSKDPMSKASAALTSPRGGINGGGYFCR